MAKAKKLGHVSRPKQWEVLKRGTRALPGVKLDEAHKYRFDARGQFITSDAGVARDLQKLHKPEVVVMEVDQPKPRGYVSQSFFGSLPEMPWKVKKAE